jgi:long-chain acyl-CoA synthetase
LNVHLYKRPPLELPADFNVSMALFTADAGGDPKGVLRSDEEQRTVAAMLAEALDLQPEERLLSAAALHHGFGYDAGLLTPLSRGASLYLEDELSVKRLSKILRDESIDVFPGNPTLFGALAREVTVKPLTTKKARFLSAGSPLPANVATSFLERYRVRLINTYHVTEVGPISCDRQGKEPGTQGKTFAGVELRIGDPDATNDAPSAGKAGDEPRPIWVRSPGISPLFVPRLPLDQRGGIPIGRRNDAGWFRTGDLGTLDKAGRLTLAGREDDLVKVDGKRVALGEVAGCLESHPKVKEAEAHLAHDEVGNPIVVAHVVSSGPCRAEDLIDHCARSLAPYKVPRQIELNGPTPSPAPAR